MVLYNEWNDKLIEEFGLDLRTLPSPSGVYADTAWLLCSLVSLQDINRVYEAGAGTSTVIFAIMCERLNKDLVTFEDKPEWAEKTDRDLSVRNLSHRVISTDSKIENTPEQTKPFDLAWTDGNVFWDSKRMGPAGPENINYYGKFCHRPGGVRYHQHVLTDAVIMYDDGQDTNCLIEIIKVEREMERDPNKMFLSNPTNRHERHQLVSLPYDGHPAEELIKDMGHWYPITDILDHRHEL